MTTDFRALCAELVDELHDFQWAVQEAGVGWACSDTESLIDRARAALAEPEPEGPTDEEIGEWADACSEAPLEELDPEVHGWRRCFTAQEFSETIRAALARWGNHPGSPDSSPQPVPVSERLPKEPLAWWFTPESDEEYGWWVLEPDGMEREPQPTHWLPANALPLPQPS